MSTSKWQAWMSHNAWWYGPLVLPFALVVLVVALVWVLLVRRGKSRKAPKPEDPGAWMTSDAAMAEALRKDAAEKAARENGEA